MTVDTIQIGDKQPAPEITRETVTIDGEQVEQVRGSHEYAHVLLPADAAVTVDVKVDGVVVTTLGPWTAIERAEKTAMAQVRLRVSDDCDQTTLGTEPA